MEAEDKRTSRSKETEDRSRKTYCEWPLRTGSSYRRRLVSRAPSASAVHRDVDEHHSLGRVSKLSAKKGCISDLMYDVVQEASLKQRREEKPRRVRQVDSSPEDDRGQAGIDAALDDQALDLVVNYTSSTCLSLIEESPNTRSKMFHCDPTDGQTSDLKK